MVACTSVARERTLGGTSTRLNIVHAPNPEFEKRIARAAIDFVIEQFGHEEAQHMTLEGDARVLLRPPVALPSNP